MSEPPTHLLIRCALVIPTATRRKVCRSAGKPDVEEISVWVPVSLLRSHKRATHATVQTLEHKLSEAHEKIMQRTLTFELNMPAEKYGALSAGTYHITERDMMLKLKGHDSMTPFNVAMAFMSVPMHRCLVCGVTETVDRGVGK